MYSATQLDTSIANFFFVIYQNFLLVLEFKHHVDIFQYGSIQICKLHYLSDVNLKVSQCSLLLCQRVFVNS